MTDRWTVRPFAEAVDFKEGPGIMARDFRQEGVPLIRLAGVKPGTHILAGCNYLDPEMVERKWAHFRVAEGDVILSTSASLGEVARVTQGGVGAIPYTGLIRMRGHDGVLDQDFLPWVLRAPDFAAQVRAMGVGSVMNHFGPSHLRQMTLTLPPLVEQQRIAGVLGSLDDLIETNKRLISHLGALGAALLANLAATGFSLLDGDSGDGWSLRSLGEATKVLESGSRPRGGVAGIASGVPSIGAESIRGIGLFDFAKTKFVPSEFAAAMRRGQLESRDVLVYKDGGKPGEFHPHVAMFGDGFPYESMVINEHVYRVRAAAPLSNPYLYFWLSSERLLAQMALLGTGAAIPGLNSTAFKSLSVAIPPDEVCEMLLPALDALVGATLGAAREARELVETRDELLPLLLSGAVTVAEVSA